MENRAVSTCGFGGISVELGDRRRAVSSIEDVAGLFKAQNLPMSPGLLGYEYFHESTLAPEEPISRVMANALASTGVDPADVDMLLVASADVSFLADRQFLPRLMDRSGLSAALPLTITSQECTSLLSAINLAGTYLESRSSGNVLVVSYDRVEADARRIQSFGVLSDAAAACLVSSPHGGSEFRTRGFSHGSDLRGMRGEDDFASRKVLSNKVTGDILAQGGISIARVRKVFATNFFRPVARYNASALALAEQQLYLDRAPEIGHCLCADPLINFSFFQDEAPSWELGDLYLLQAYAPGIMASLLVERIAEPVRGKDSPRAQDVVVQSW